MVVSNDIVTFSFSLVSTVDVADAIEEAPLDKCKGVEMVVKIVVNGAVVDGLSGDDSHLTLKFPLIPP